ncbi:MAG: peptidase T [Rothia sp. (in: high G+C Gram-positive bacteria)]|uniref:peptidase T n=1 Tax=Rothia sp. (in: high G+C Gram-positive bacteria) TaxID=1885016 RepID=UPI00270824D6|nr:peptidase T [Rothia sp. (in: high G+C Gram-positive bacteria)]
MSTTTFTPTYAPDTALQEALAARFLRYSAISSQSDASATAVPTSEGQWELARLLEAELREAGAQEVHLSDTCVLTARIPSTLPSGIEAPAIGFCTHLDTVDVNLSPEVHARIIDYRGGDIYLNPELDIWLREAEHPEITRYTGQRIIVTDGTSVLGADDKAGVASVMEAAVRLLAADADATGQVGRAAQGAGAGTSAHPDIYLSFVPDEEIGLLGVRTMDLARFPVDYAYTLDCCELGELVEATFNAGHARLHVEGVTAHPMNSKGNLVNPILVAHDFIAQLDRAQTPEHTEGREGYLWVNSIDGNQATTTVDISIRDHDRAGYDSKKAFLRDLAERTAETNPRASVRLDISDIYSNLEDAKTNANAVASERLRAAFTRLGIVPINLAMRGGTDGSYLSTQGIYTPNFFTGAHNFHSNCEFLPLPAFEASYRVVRELMAG